MPAPSSGGGSSRGGSAGGSSRGGSAGGSSRGGSAGGSSRGGSAGGRSSGGRSSGGGRNGAPPHRSGPHRPASRAQNGRQGSRDEHARETRIELTFLPGLGDVLRDEVAEVLRPRRPATPVVGRDDALAVAITNPLPHVRRLTTAVAAFLVLHFDVPRPRSLSSGDHLSRIVEAMYASLRVAGSSTFRFEAAGSDSSAFTRLGAELAAATGLKYDEKDGELVVRVRRGPTRGEQDPGWDVLVRIGNRPLSARPWRSADYPGAANATIAAAMVRLAGNDPEDRVVNLMCGSGTLLIERLLAGPAAAAVGIDDAPDAIAAATENLEAAGLKRAARLVTADIRDDSLDGGYDLLLADPPWGTLHGSHATNADLHAALLQSAHRLAAPGARLLVLTHEIKLMERCLRETEQWTVRSVTRVFAKGHHPRIYVLDRA
ncbi:methyltransferase [Cellulomonas edaphi]|uniref:Methyltransferase n=1 Tax=Cellulomonas edaphi TaxID=3053468 RepID=A0ABT7S2Z1_9CELL|nr:methyltransferase [Cellulomons edaphi]MDM7829985.1 methyltransferase [Cellulomons edaphi]